MLTRLDRGWSTVTESLRRERNVHDLTARSGASRLHRRVTVPATEKEDWRRFERLIVEIEKRTRAIDIAALDFWVQYRRLEDELLKVYHDAGVRFEAR